MMCIGRLGHTQPGTFALLPSFPDALPQVGPSSIAPQIRDASIECLRAVHGTSKRWSTNAAAEKRLMLRLQT